MKPNDTNQGEGNRDADRQYRNDVREFISKGKVGDAARDAKDFVDTHPIEAKADEAKAKAGHTSTVDELVAKGRSVVDRLRRAVGDLRDKYATRK